MSYNFKSLGEVELLNTIPETANVFVEVDGGIRRAPKEDGVGKLVAVETLAEVPEGATVLAEVGGEIKRVPSDGLGGGKALIIKSSDFDNVMAGIATVEAEIPADTYTANMTFNEVMAAFASGELIGGFLFDAINGRPFRYPIITMYYDTSNSVVPCLLLMALEMSSQTMVTLFWTADGGISTEAPESAVGPS